MAYLSVEHAVPSHSKRRLGGFRLLREACGILALVGAAARVSGAIEARRRPEASDLDILGLDIAKLAPALRG